MININIFQFWFIWKGYRFNFIKAEVDIDEAGIVSKVKTSETIFSRFNVLTVEGIGGNSLKSRYDKSRDAMFEL